MPLAPGDRLGPFEILEKIGAGGMGEVYKARDTRLDRIVALKTSKQQFTERFEREAKAVAQLNHPNVCTLHDVGPDYLVMEFVEGAPPKGTLPLDEALRIARQIVAALEAAHEKHITHRDLKPGNVMVKPDGHVKVLDFGLAKLAPPPRTDLDSENSPTLTMSMTDAGMVVGTAAYMAPEQAKGAHVDKRADIWAFGVLLYELLAGKRPFQGNDIAEILASVIKEQPDYEKVPFEVWRLIQRCLEKDPAKRLRDIGDVWDLLDQPPAATAPVVIEKRPSKLPWAIAATLALTTGAASYWAWQASRPVERPLARLSVDLGPDAVAGTGSTLFISPDGNRIVYSTRIAGKAGATTRTLDQSQPTPMPASQAGPFSPDGEWFLQAVGGDGQYKVSVHGGAPIPLAKYGFLRGADWFPNNDLIVAGADSPSVRTRLGIAPADGGPLRFVSKQSSDTDANFPQLLPDGQTVLFTAQKPGDTESAVVSTFSLKSGDTKDIWRGGYFGRYLPTRGSTGHLVWMSHGTLFGAKFDPASLTISGSPVPLLQDVATNLTIGSAQLAFSKTGTFCLYPKFFGRWQLPATLLA